MYGKVFASMYDGTLYGHWQAIVTFQQLIVLCDSDGVIDMTPQAVAARTSIPFEIIEKGIGILEQPDPYSRTPGEDGRRIVRLDTHRPWGWQIVNHRKYKLLVDQETIREQNRERQRRHRAGLSRDVTDGHGPSRSVTDVTPSHAPSRHADADADADADAGKTTTAAAPPIRSPRIAPRGTDADWWLDFKLAYPHRAGDQSWGRARKAANARQAEGHTPAEFIAGAQRYAAFCQATGKLGTEFVKQAATFLGPDKHFLQSWDLPLTKGEVHRDQNIAAGLEWLAQAEANDAAA